jgi:hypothetical protein
MRAMGVFDWNQGRSFALAIESLARANDGLTRVSDSLVCASDALESVMEWGEAIRRGSGEAAARGVEHWQVRDLVRMKGFS